MSDQPPANNDLPGGDEGASTTADAPGVDAQGKATAHLGEEPLLRLLVRLGLPGVASLLAIALYGVVDTFWVAKLGDKPMAGLTVVFPFEMFRVALGVGTGTGILSLASRCFGTGDTVKANRIAGQIGFLTFALGLPMLAAGALWPEAIVQACGADAAVTPYAASYLYMLSFGSPFIVFAMMGSNLLRGAGDTWHPMIFLGVSALSNVILDPFLIFGLGPFPKMGVQGAALATVIAQIWVVAYSLIWFFRSCKSYHVRPADLLPSLSILRGIYQIGFPSFCLTALGAANLWAYAYCLKPFGAAAVAAYGIMFRTLRLVYLPIFGFGQGMMSIVGYNYGAGLYGRLWKTVKAGTGLAIGITVVSFVFFQSLAEPVSRIFTSDPTVLSILPRAFHLQMALHFLTGPLVIWVILFQGMGRGGIVLFFSFLRRLLLTLPLLFTLPRYLGLDGIWLSQPLADLVCFLLLGSLVLREWRRHPVRETASAESV